MSLEPLYQARIDALAAHKGVLISEIALALAMAYHPRLGSSAKLGTLPPEIVEKHLAPRMPWTYPVIPLTQGVKIEPDKLPEEESLWIDSETVSNAQYRLTFQGHTLMAAGGIRDFVQYLSPRVDHQQLFVDMYVEGGQHVMIAVYHYDYKHIRCNLIKADVISSSGDDRTVRRKARRVSSVPRSFSFELTDDVRIDVWYNAG